ncbi:hypothetical protein P691DRAFT_761034 [Macrolepiota fuliginosa MF-IS2]|uniref:Calcium-channel protein CCH1 n=1 Tax=Macrolepiota fuliginosa MF-IS2 TaxID=1400762 RepID=A0A9P5X9F0_9AGAR|nr:hypothetical protein P691DRAFT_761034 [Macrolepiota fuliginosa MF-IS2]
MESLADDFSSNGFSVLPSPSLEPSSGHTPLSRGHQSHELAAQDPLSRNLRRVSLRVVKLAGSGGSDDASDRHSADLDEDLPEFIKATPIRGYTLGCLGPNSRLRHGLYQALVYSWTEAIILGLIVLNAVILSVQAFPSLTFPQSDPPALTPTAGGYFNTWEDWALFILFSIFTLEAFARICVVGLLFDPEIQMSSLFSSAPLSAHPDPSRQPSLSRGSNIPRHFRLVLEILCRPFALNIYEDMPFRNQPVPRLRDQVLAETQPENDKSEGSLNPTRGDHDALRHPAGAFLSRATRPDENNRILLPFRLSITHKKARYDVPYLRQSWNRIDFIAVVSFWIMFSLAVSGSERGRHHIGIFRAMSVVRIVRLLTVTSGTMTIMNSLRIARPPLMGVAYFVGFIMVLFSIIGVQFFKGLLRRSCVLSATQGEEDILLDGQFCGGYIDPTTFQRIGYQMLKGGNAPTTKGYICPLGQICKEGKNPKDNLESFDAIWYAALQVIVITTNGGMPLMYAMIDSEDFILYFFFIICVVILNFWLINLFVAVITYTFAAIRSTTKKSAFGIAPLVLADQDAQDDGWNIIGGPHTGRVRQNCAKIIYEPTRWCWVLLSFISLVLQASHQVDISQTYGDRMLRGELGITIAFDIEIILRILAALPEWRSFWLSGRNVLDLGLAIGCSVIQIPVIRESEVYRWLTVLQLARFYRVILEVPRMKPLLLAAFGPLSNLVNMCLFLILINYIFTLIVVQLLRGDFMEDNTTNYAGLFNAFLATWQVFSSESWTDVLYGTTHVEIKLGQPLIVIILIVPWVLFSNFVVLQMFIAVIHENFNAAEEVGRTKRTNELWEVQVQKVGEREDEPRWMRLLNAYWLFKPATVRTVDNELLNRRLRAVEPLGLGRSATRHLPSKTLTALGTLFNGSNNIPLVTLTHEIQPQLELLGQPNPGQGAADGLEDELHRRRALKADFINKHPSHDKVFWIIPQSNRIRKLCQKVVRPVRGERLFGTPCSPIAHPVFQLAILLTVVGGIVVESIATPMYRRNYYRQHGLIRGAWFDIAEAAFGLTLFVEFMIKVIADGFIWTPNAYLLGIWNLVDFAIMIGIIVNITTGFIIVGGLSRLTRSLKALRALRLITLIDNVRNTLQSLIISGASRILEAAVLAILCIIPYAVWGFNIFAGKMRSCNDKGATSMAECIGEYENSVVGKSFGYMVPRVWNNPSLSTSFSFDSFRTSLLVLFEIMSLEGWTDVMFTATSITGRDRQPQNNASQANALFFLIFNLLGSVIILALFTSIIIRNFGYETGYGFLTQPQREWIDLQRFLKLQKPSKRPSYRPTSGLKAWCYDRAVHNHGWWSRSMTVLFLLHLFALMIQTFSTGRTMEILHKGFFFAVLFIYTIDVVVRWYGLGWRTFRANGWNLFDLVAAFGGLLVTLITYFGSTGVAAQQLQKLILVGIAFKLVQRTDTLNMWFKTVLSSMPVILRLLGLWLILSIYFGTLFVEVFGMTKWGNHENRNKNYSSLGPALVMLTFMSAGEGWNKYMHDFDLVYPRCTNASLWKVESDCGSTAWAFTLFIAWNLLSTYIFVNMFTGAVAENFSHVFQASNSGAKSISREQMRAFKKLWAEYTNRKGYLERHSFGPFFSRLSGVFEVKIYPTEFSVQNIKSTCSTHQDSTTWVYSHPYGPQELDLRKLAMTLNRMDPVEIRKRKATFSRLYHEAIWMRLSGVFEVKIYPTEFSVQNIKSTCSTYQDSTTWMYSHPYGPQGLDLRKLATTLNGMDPVAIRKRKATFSRLHHEAIISCRSVDGEALVLKDLVVRTEVNKVVSDLVNLDRVRSLLMTVSHRRRFLAMLEERKRMSRVDYEVPSNTVQLPESSFGSTRDIVNASYSVSPSSSPTLGGAQLRSLGISFAPGGSRLQRNSRRNGGSGVLPMDAAFRSPHTSVVEEDTQDILSTRNSVQGDFVRNAVEDTGKPLI